MSVARQTSVSPRTPPHCKTCGQPKKGHPVRCPLLDSPKSSAPPATITVKNDYVYSGTRIAFDGIEYTAYKPASVAPITPTNRHCSAGHGQTVLLPSSGTLVTSPPNDRALLRNDSHQTEDSHGNERSRQVRGRQAAQRQRRGSSTPVSSFRNETEVEVSQPPLRGSPQHRLYSPTQSESRRPHVGVEASHDGSGDYTSYGAEQRTYTRYSRTTAVAAYGLSADVVNNWEQNGGLTAQGNSPPVHYRLRAVREESWAVTRITDKMDFWRIAGIIVIGCVMGAATVELYWRL
ncbi:hypothetical protein BDY19DRAFT_924055 [Irpex rosettiformis]|uniref:Uncharacterized protein n=1 Tax=Irpex rosettiformis TaxID=378272 RepID=A0ACB8UDZ3_9APHY|nr:hypothetical protein BDY19DRAFT_924055 [Irpex rosettiformis]